MPTSWDEFEPVTEQAKGDTDWNEFEPVPAHEAYPIKTEPWQQPGADLGPYASTLTPGPARDQALAEVQALGQISQVLPNAIDAFGNAVVNIADMPARIARTVKEGQGIEPPLLLEEMPPRTLPKVQGEGALAGAANVGVNLVNQMVPPFAPPQVGLTMPLVAGRVPAALFGANMLQAAPQEFQHAATVVRDPNATTAEKVEAVGNPIAATGMGLLMLKHAAKEPPTPAELLARELDAAQPRVTVRDPNAIALDEPRRVLPPEGMVTAEDLVQAKPEKPAHPKLTKRKQNAVDKYLSEQIDYGGETKTRGEVIREMQQNGIPQKQIDAYMMGAKPVNAKPAEAPKAEAKASPIVQGSQSGTPTEAMLSRREFQKQNPAAEKTMNKEFGYSGMTGIRAGKKTRYQYVEEAVASGDSLEMFKNRWLKVTKYEEEYFKFLEQRNAAKTDKSTEAPSAPASDVATVAEKVEHPVEEVAPVAEEAKATSVAPTTLEKPVVKEDLRTEPTEPTEPTVFWDDAVKAFTATRFDERFGNMHGTGATEAEAVESLNKHMQAAQQHGTWRSVEHRSTAEAPAVAGEKVQGGGDGVSQYASEAEKATQAWGKFSVDTVDPLKQQVREAQNAVDEMYYIAQRALPDYKGKNKLTQKAALKLLGVASKDEANALYRAKGEQLSALKEQLKQAETHLAELAKAKDTAGQNWSRAVTILKESQTAQTAQPTPEPVGMGGAVASVSGLTPAESARLAELTDKVESGAKMTAAEQKRYAALRDKATGKTADPGVSAVRAGPGASTVADIGAESPAQTAALRIAEAVNDGVKAKDIPVADDMPVRPEDLRSTDPAVEQRWQSARLARKSIVERGKAALETAKNHITRHFPFLDPKRDAVVTEILRNHQNDPLHAKYIASEALRGITAGLAHKSYDVFTRIVILRDLMKYGQRFAEKLEGDLPFGYKSLEAISTDLARFEAMAERFPKIKESLKRRDEFMDALRYELVARDILPPQVKDFGEYFHHQVLEYMAMRDSLPATPGSKDVRTHTQGWQKARTGSAKDYNTNYLESEFEMVSQAFEQMATQDTVKRLDQWANIVDSLKAAATDLRETGREADWRQLIPDDYTTWQPERGNHFYWVNSIGEKALQAYLRGERTLTEADIREVLALGGPKREWVIPKRLAKTLDNFTPPKDHVAEKFVGAGVAQWKRWTLFNPMRNVIYNLNNLSGDLDISLAVDPKIVKYAPEAARELWRFVEKKRPATDELNQLIKLGVVDSGFSVQELPDLKGQQFFRVLNGERPNLIGKYWETVLDFNRWREGVLRYAAYKRALELLNEGKRPLWTSKKSEMDSLYADPQMTREWIAAKLAREAIGDYGNISSAGQWIRSKMVPFWAWIEINSPRYARLIKNSMNDGTLTPVGRAGAIAAKRTVGSAAKLAFKMGFLYTLVNLWNKSFFPNEEKELADSRDQLHLILGRDEETGKVRTIRFQGALSDALSWFGMENFPQDIDDLQTGKSSLGDKGVQAAKAPVNKLVNASFPIQKTLFEAIVGRKTYPDVFRPGYVRDPYGHVARLFSMGTIYDYFAGKPQPKGTFSPLSLATYTSDPGEAAYYTARTIITDKVSDIRRQRSDALYYYKQALKFGDQKLADEWEQRYFDLGGREEGKQQSVRAASVWYGASKKDEIYDSLTPAEKEIVDRGEAWYEKTYR